jgi:hypothetical protein
LLELLVFGKCCFDTRVPTLQPLVPFFGIGPRWEDEPVIDCEDLGGPEVGDLGLLMSWEIGVVNHLEALWRAEFGLSVLHGPQGVHEFLLTVYHRVLLLVLDLHHWLLLVVEE